MLKNLFHQFKLIIIHCFIVNNFILFYFRISLEFIIINIIHYLFIIKQKMNLFFKLIFNKDLISTVSSIPNNESDFVGLR